MTAPATLTRTTFETSRLLEFFTEKELQMQIGHAKEYWSIALLKELVDNALDACESADVPPAITVTIEANRLRVRDNGPGLPFATLERSLDYAVRVSDKAFYVSPTRGQLGNALKCVYAAPYVLDGEQGRVEVATGGQRHTITIRLDRLGQRPVLEMAAAADDVKTGTEVVVHWPAVASSFVCGGHGFYMPSVGFYEPAHLVARYALLNPHLAIAYDGPGGPLDFAPTTPGWQKWQPNHPTSPHWYTPERLRGLLAAYLTADRDGGRSRTVREVVAEFAGLSGTAKQKLVTAEVGLTGARLEELVVNGDLAPERIAPLLAAMQRHSRVIKPAALGVLGAAHLRQRLVEHYGITAESFRYAKEVGTSATGVPWVVETALGFFRAEGRAREVLSGVNFSPLVDVQTFRSVITRLGAHRIDPHDPVAFVIHLANPRVRFSDRGKSVLALEDDDEVAA
jgi:DNA topoisomerase VI subunit B